MKGIKSRIYKQNGIIIISIVLILEIIFLLVVRNYYFQSVQQELLNKVKVSGGFYNKYLINERIEEKARYILENDSRDPVFYMQVYDTNRRMLTDSNGLKSNEPIDAADIKAALNEEMQIIKEKNNETKESIMAVSTPLYHLGEISGALRYTVSVEKIETMLLKIFFASIFIGVFVVIITFLLSSFLAKGIVYPIEEVTKVAEIMAAGDFTKRAVKINNDEIGKLSDTLNYMSEEIQKSNLIKNEFISSISHELRTPLTAIQGWSEIILTGEVENLEEAKEGLKIISSETKRLTGLVEELLDFSKFEAGKISLNLEKVDINQLTMEVYNYFKKRFEKVGIEVSLNIEKKPCYAAGDVNRLKQVLINIIDNAIKFSEEDGKISINTYLRQENVLIQIEDNGIGIPKKDIHKVTHKFYKGKSKKSGSGIGLSICKEIIHLHGGELSIDSVEGEGTKVNILIPIEY
ncbi:sensor histidine kinase [Clostridium ganghwense]|uniref:histidine kinase n=1 Tax=Clostridium ganghwense TaxID=312089 RepID=A0ABT4CSY4_9CLOT|nr:HAMP domain-containing sensor histidine kinase [Clostridium ganghwense]MCY6371306.1 HAMP domain-containing sensor histidine kinase [Clostridium ganghwense]